MMMMLMMTMRMTRATRTFFSSATTSLYPRPLGGLVGCSQAVRTVKFCQHPLSPHASVRCRTQAFQPRIDRLILP
eukprot:10106277-Lingulodinium_polyedra.AAC.1